MDNKKSIKSKNSTIQGLLELMEDERLFPPGHDICLRCCRDLGIKDPATGWSPSRDGHICSSR